MTRSRVSEGLRWVLPALLFLLAAWAPRGPGPSSPESEAPAAAGGVATPPPYAEAIARFERRDARHPPTPGGVLFVGSSSIRMWKTLHVDMAPMNVLNRGFGGATTTDVLRYVDRIVLPYRPRAIVYYAGDNDVGRDQAEPARVLERFQSFVSAVKSSGRATHVHFVSIKPSPKRMKSWPQMREANALVRDFTRSDPSLSYIDVAREMLRADGRPRHELYAADGVHMSPAGYRLWSRLIKPAVMAEDPSDLFL